jgi:hypothetical protein
MEDAEDRSVYYGYFVQDAQPRRFKSHTPKTLEALPAGE